MFRYGRTPCSSSPARVAALVCGLATITQQCPNTALQIATSFINASKLRPSKSASSKNASKLILFCRLLNSRSADSRNRKLV